ncbi:hypothetical protein B0H11DRAFT_1923116 [Mycena galericulata]|nr:hypothetical protein B0H11DRAFT_1923116 [Mycena galericulata]
MASHHAQLLALLLAPGFQRFAYASLSISRSSLLNIALSPYVALPKLHVFSHHLACQCIDSDAIGTTDGEGVERPQLDTCLQHGELAPRFDWAFQYHIDDLRIDDLHIDDDDDEMPGLMSQDESDSLKTNRVRGFKPRNLFLQSKL